MSKNTPHFYPQREEQLNVLTHGFGCLLSILGFYFLVKRALNFGDTTALVSFLVFGSSLILLYAASTLYHATQTISKRLRFAIIDHAAIYVLIAGTYTPFSLIILPDQVGWIIFCLVWTCALVGIVLKLFFTGKYVLISTLMYVAMGWIVVFVLDPLLANFALEGFYWLLAGGISYTVGAVFFMLDNKLNYNHAIFHVFILGGSFCHFWAVYEYVVPIF